MTAQDLLTLLFLIDQIFAIAACAVMSGTRRSSRPWYFATKMLWWATMAGVVNIAALFGLFLLDR